MILEWLLATCLVPSEPTDPTATLRAIAHDIEALGRSYPQLAGFEARTHFDEAGLRIDYAYRTHAAAQGGGWTAGVPRPDDGGVWFHIDVHPADSTLQLHTQPVTPAWCLGDKRVSLLILEGQGTRAVGGELQKILEARGAKPCGRPQA